MIYRVHYDEMADGSRGYVYAASRRQAKALLRAWRKTHPESRCDDIDCQPVPKTKRALIDLLNRWGAHPDNG